MEIATKDKPLFAKVQREIETAGVRATKHRLLVYFYLHRYCKQHSKALSVQELIDFMRNDNYRPSQATVYRALRLLCRLGLANQCLSVNEQELYDCESLDATDAKVICSKCGRIETLADTNLQKIKEQIMGQRGFEQGRHQLHFYADCRKEECLGSNKKTPH